MPLLKIVVPAPGFQRQPHRFRPVQGKGWLRMYEAEHAVGLLEAVGRTVEDPIDHRPFDTGPFPRPGGWSWLRVAVDDLGAARQAVDAYYDEHFTACSPWETARAADRVTDGVRALLAMLAAMTGDPGLAVAADVARGVDEGVDRIIEAAEAGESVIAAAAPEVRSVLADIVEAVEADMEREAPTESPRVAGVPPRLSDALRGAA